MISSNPSSLASDQLAIAILDDEPSVRLGLSRLCRLLGFRTSIYASGTDLIAAIESDVIRPDCLLLDAHMPQMTGLDVHQYLVKKGARIPVVVYTADDTPDARTRYLAAGAAEYLRKPIGSQELLAAVSRATLMRTFPSRGDAWPTARAMS